MYLFFFYPLTTKELACSPATTFTKYGYQCTVSHCSGCKLCTVQCN